MNTQAVQQALDAYTPGKLRPGIHDTLVAEINRIAHEAGISPRDITGADYALTVEELAYLTDFRKVGQTGALGLIYVGQHSPPAIARARSVCGALLRNFITARLIVREELVSDLFDNRRQPRADLVAVPDFGYKDAPASTRRALVSWLMGRIARGGQTLLGVPDKATLMETFGAEAPQYLKHFRVLSGVQFTA